MPTKSNSFIITDFIPRTLEYERREVNVVRRSHLAQSQPAKTEVPTVSTRRRLFSWSPKYIGLLIGAVTLGLYVAGSIGGQATGTMPATVSAATIHEYEGGKKEKVTPGLPVRLRIPSINADVHIESVGLTPEGAMDVPKTETNTGWFDQGPRPGEKGSSVINGHFGLKNRTAAAFDNLHLLKKGDKLYIEDEKGMTTTFVVREFRTYKPDEGASGVFTSNDGRAHLNLITCQGAWNKVEKSYSNRLVAFTDQEI